MNDPLADELRERGVDGVRTHAPLAPLTTLRVGGSARILAVVETVHDLVEVGSVCRDHDLPWVVIGRGSNLLVDDRGWPGIAIQLGRGLRGVEVAGTRVRAGASEPLPAAAARVAEAGLAGFAWAIAVPGTIGGAVRMNAGAHGSEMVDHLVDVDVVRLDSGEVETLPASSLGLSYRHSELPQDAVVVRATLRLSVGDRDHERAEIDRIRAWRREHQPLHEPNCGSVFTNPTGDSAGRIIESAGAKGLAVGGATVSDRHANFIVTRPGATADDVRSLIEEVRLRARESTGIHLETEVVLLDHDGGASGLDEA